MTCRFFTVRSLLILTALGASLVFESAALAQLPSPRFDRLLPLGAAAGTTLDAEILGDDIEGLTELRFDHPGIKGTPIAEKPKFFRLAIAADVPAGTYDVRLVGKYGVSNPRLFAVSRGLTDVTEKEPNNNLETAQAIALNQALNGQSDGNDQDVFRLTLAAGKRVTIDCQSGKLDTALDGNLALLSTAGVQLAASSDYHGRDPFIDFVAPGAADYFIVVNDLSFRGGHPYRLIVSDLPQIENVFPRVMQFGQPANLTVLGRNLGSTGKPSGKQLLDQMLEEAPLTLPSPTNPANLFRYQFLEHPTDHSVRPTACTATANGFGFRPNVGGEALNAISMLLVDTPVSLEAEPNDKPATPQAITLPAVVSGRFDQPRDADWYAFTVPENGKYGVEVYCERIAGQADPYVKITDEKGNRVEEFDDYGHNVNAFEANLRDPSGMVNLQAGTKYLLLVQDRYGRGGPRYQYVLSLRKPQPDFFVASIHSQNPGPGGTNVWRGGAVHFDVIIHQRDEFRAPVTITAEGLPPGLHSAPTSIFQNNVGQFVIWADENAAEWVGPIQLIATGKRGDETLRREVRPHCRISQDFPSRAMQSTVIGVREKAPFSVKFVPDKITIEAGQKADVKIQVTRLWPEFKEKVNLIGVNLSGHTKVNNAEIPADQTEVTLPIEITPNTPPGEFTITMLGQGQVPFNKDPAAKEKPNKLVSLPCQPLTITVTEAPKPVK